MNLFVILVLSLSPILAQASTCSMSLGTEGYLVDKIIGKRKVPMTTDFTEKLKKPTHFDGAIDFKALGEEYYTTSLNHALREARQKLESLANNSKAPDFENTILAMEELTETLGQVAGVFSNLHSANNSEVLEKQSADMEKIMAAFSNEIYLNEKLYQRVEEVYQNSKAKPLAPQEQRLLEETRKSFVRNGASLNEADKAELRKIDAELAELSSQFKANVQEATSNHLIVIKEEARLKGVPEAVLEQAKEFAEKKGQKSAWAFNLGQTFYLPVMLYAQDRSLREEFYRAYGARALEGKNSNQEVIQKLLALKTKRAQLLGYKTYTDYVLSDRMVKNKSTVDQFLERLIEVALPAAKKEVELLKKYMKEEYGTEDIQAWDVNYLIEKAKEKIYGFNEEELRAYFPQNQVLDGLFDLLNRLYGLSFKERSDIPTYQEDVKAFEVTKGDEYIGILYMDLYARDNKKPGAWMTNFREQGRFQGKERRPHISIVGNFRKPSGGQPALMSLDEVNTLFHEMGHALHGLLSHVQFRSIAGTNVVWDFVELPSQFMENWILEKEVFFKLAKHYKTKVSPSEELYKKIVESHKFMQGYATIRQVTFAKVDLAWHSHTGEISEGVEAFENKIKAPLQLVPAVPGTSFSASFLHIFAGGYDSGYYSYKWAEVLDADAFSYFKIKGLFDPQVAKAFYENVLSKGNSEEAMVLYKRFRGAQPDPDALLRRQGLLPEAQS